MPSHDVSSPLANDRDVFPNTCSAKVLTELDIGVIRDLFKLYTVAGQVKLRLALMDHLKLPGFKKQS